MTVVGPSTPEEERLVDLVSCTVADVLKHTARSANQGQTEISAKLAEIAQNTALMSQRFDQMATLVARHDVILRGNGHPGLVEQVNRVAPMIEEDHQILKGDGERPGMVSRLKTVEDKVDSAAKPIITIVTVALTSITTWVISTLLK
jgi:hypothetical protein